MIGSTGGSAEAAAGSAGNAGSLTRTADTTQVTVVEAGKGGATGVGGNGGTKTALPTGKSTNGVIGYYPPTTRRFSSPLTLVTTVVQALTVPVAMVLVPTPT